MHPFSACSFLAAPGGIRFADFPTLGVDTNAVYLAGDMYHGTNNSLGTSLTMILQAGVQWTAQHLLSKVCKPSRLSAIYRNRTAR
ncbi:MAG TPA: hypothetical protein VN784_15180 [Candidatus Limnocylindrales bacterium]|nr:hypothetical protein [Candidatus Limnocylindrales bacterium]